MTNQDLLQVKVSTAEKVLFEGPALSLSSTDPKGDFDMMIDHTNFITVIKDKVIIFQEDNKQQEFTLDMGILRCFNDNIEIFLGVKVLPETLSNQPQTNSPQIKTSQDPKYQTSQLK